MLISYSCSMSSLIPSVEETVSSTVHSMGSIERKCFGVPVKLRGGQKLGKKLRRDTLGTPKCPSPPPPSTIQNLTKKVIQRQKCAKTQGYKEKTFLSLFVSLIN